MVVLVAIYFAALEDVNILNALFVVMLIVFLVFPKFARDYWIAMLLYTQAVILIEYIWGFPLSDGVSEDVSNLIGLDSNAFDHLWDVLDWHLAILLLATIQWNANEKFADSNQILPPGQQTVVQLASSGGTSDLTTPLLSEEDHEPAMDPPRTRLSPHQQQRGEDHSSEGAAADESELEMETSWTVERYLEYFRLAILTGWLWIAWMSLLVYGIYGEVTVFRLGFLGLWSLYALVYFLTPNYFQRTRILWPLATIYTALVFAMLYLYQFEDIRNKWQDNLNETIIRDFGLIFQNSQTDRFSYLVGAVSTISPRRDTYFDFQSSQLFGPIPSIRFLPPLFSYSLSYKNDAFSGRALHLFKSCPCLRTPHFQHG